MNICIRLTALGILLLLPLTGCKQEGGTVRVQEKNQPDLPQDDRRFFDPIPTGGPETSPLTSPARDPSTQGEGKAGGDSTPPPPGRENPPVPEPHTFLIVGTGLALLARSRRRRRKV